MIPRANADAARHALAPVYLLLSPTLSAKTMPGVQTIVEPQNAIRLAAAVMNPLASAVSIRMFRPLSMGRLLLSLSVRPAISPCRGPSTFGVVDSCRDGEGR